MTSNTALISITDDAKLSFGDYSLTAKAKQPDFSFQGDLYKVKTFQEITKLEKNERFLYESVPGTAVTSFAQTDRDVDFDVSGYADTQITLELAENTAYEVVIDGVSAGTFSTNIGGKLSLSVDLTAARKHIHIAKKD